MKSRSRYFSRKLINQCSPELRNFAAVKQSKIAIPLATFPQEGPINDRYSEPRRLSFQRVGVIRVSCPRISSIEDHNFVYRNPAKTDNSARQFREISAVADPEFRAELFTRVSRVVMKKIPSSVFFCQLDQRLKNRAAAAAAGDFREFRGWSRLVVTNRDSRCREEYWNPVRVCRRHQ